MNLFRVIRAADLLSLLNALLGFGSILAAFNSKYDTCVLLIILAAIADGLDGFLARKLGPGPLGTNLDSLADLISFGVAPAVFVSSALGIRWQTIAIGAIYIACGMLRLARFDVTPKNDQLFEGLPIPPCGLAVSSSALLGRTELTLALMIILSALMVSSIPYPKIRNPRIALPLAVISLIMILGIWIKMGQYSPPVLSYSIITAMIMYMASPVVMPFLRKER